MGCRFYRFRSYSGSLITLCSRLRRARPSLDIVVPAEFIGTDEHFDLPRKELASVRRGQAE